MKQKYSTWILAFLFVAGVIIIYKTVDNFNNIFAFFGTVMRALGPFITGFVIAYLLNIPIKKVKALAEKSRSRFVKKHSKGVSITAVYLLALILISIILRTVIPAVYKNLMDLYLNVPYYLELMVEKINELQLRFDINLIDLDKQNAIDGIQSFIKNIRLSEFGKYAQGVINATSGVFNVFISIIISVYMLADKQLISESIKRVLNAFVPREKVQRFVEFAARTNDIFSKYIFSVVMDGLIVGILSTIIMSLLKVKYAPVLGLMIGVFSLIPYFGAIVAVSVAIIATLLTGGWLQALWTGIALIVLQQIDGNFIGPKIMGNMLKARPLLIIFAVTLGGGLFGLWGMILSVPVVMVIKMIFEELLRAREAKKAGNNE